MWYYLRKFEEILFYPLYLIFASLTGMPRSIRCRKCGRWLFSWRLSFAGLCENCVEQVVVSHPASVYEFVYQRQEHIIDFALSGGLVRYVYKPVAKKVGWGRVLDVGCGRGTLLAWLKSEKRKLYGFDISPTAVRIAKRINKGANCFVADARDMPFKSNTFDYTICTEVLEHIEGDEAIKECYRVLKPNGSALFSVPNEERFGGGRGGHVHSFTSKSFVCFAEQAGFEIVSVCSWGLYIPFLAPFLRGIELAFKRKLPFAGTLSIKVPEFLATNFIIECRKPPMSPGN
jgi:SAM-dependent methyltransferase